MPTAKWFDRVPGAVTDVGEDECERTDRRLALVFPATTTPERIRNSRALQHLREGFNRRIYMLDASLRFLLSTAEQSGGKPVPAYTATDLALHLNAFYLNLCGALDNLAWALQHEHQLLRERDEEKGRARLQINLFDKAFLEAFEQRAPAPALVIRNHDSWNTELKDLRDPAAHRIPIYAIPGVADQQEREEFQRLQREASQLFASGDHAGGMDRMFRSQTLGSYQPLMALSRTSGFEVRGIVPQVRQDDENLVAVSEAVLRFLFASSV